MSNNDTHQRILERIDANPSTGLADLPASDLVAFRDSVDNAPATVSLQWNTIRAYAAAGGELHRREEIRRLRLA